MAEERIFVGRKKELEQFGKVLEEPKGQAVIVVGQAGMGKTWLVNKMAEVAENHPDLKCGWVRYEVTPTDSVDSTMALMMDNAFEAAQVTEGSFDGTERRLEQWRSFLNVFNIGDLTMSLRRDQAKNTREQFLERLELVSKRMPENGRAVFIIDPEKYLQKESDYAWGLVVDRLPDKVKFLFPQRPEDVLVQGEGLDRCDNVIRIPEGELKPFDEQNIEELVSIQLERTPELEEEVRSSVKRSDKSPYAVTGTLELITSAGMKAEDLAQYLTQEDVAEAQWRGICERGDGAVRLFKAYAILEVAVPDDVVEAVSGLKSSERKKLLKDKFLRGLLREENSGRIYHVILADYIVGQISEAEKKEYHGRAVKVYREKLAEAKKAQTKPDALVAMRLPEHVLAAEGEEAFFYAFLNQCYDPLTNLGLLDKAISLSERGLKFAKKGSEAETVLLGNLGIIQCQLGNYKEAARLHKEALKNNKKLGRLNGVANQYGSLGLLYLETRDLDKAEEMLQKSLQIFVDLKDVEGQGYTYINLALVYSNGGNKGLSIQMLKKAREVFSQIGDPKIVAGYLVNIGKIYGDSGDFNKAEEIWREAFRIYKQVGNIEGMATLDFNLGMIYYTYDDRKKAKEDLQKAHDMFQKIGMKHRAREVEDWIDRLEKA